MKIKFKMNAYVKSIALCLLASSYSGTASAIDYYLCAKQENITMSDGTVVPMWGFVQDTAGFANNCVDPIQVPGPVLNVADSDTTINIHLRNVGLSEPVSIVIPGQNDTVLTPVPLPSDPTRVRSFTHETAPVAVGTDGSQDKVYSWSNVKPGTYAYQSGTHPAVQIQMGLYGAMIKNSLDAVGATPAEAYGASSAYNSSLLVFYSEIDTELHNAIADGTYGTTGMTSTVHYNPQYFLANGDDSSSGLLNVGVPGSTTLIRFINMGLQTHIPTMQGDDFSIIAEDGYPYSNPRKQYSAVLAANQTKDVLLTLPPFDAMNPVLSYAMFDRMLNLTNGSAVVTASSGGSSGLSSPGSLVTILSTNSDEDSVLDLQDNCLLKENVDQRDTNGDGYGNACDADLDNDGSIGFTDYIELFTVYGTANPDADFDGNGSVDFNDFLFLLTNYGGVPGPSGKAL